MRRLRGPLLAAVLVTPGFALSAFTSASRAEAAPATDAPFITIRKLQSLQDQVANGSAIAQSAYAKAIGYTTRTFVSADKETWRDPRNARALVVYLFSGGNAEAVSQAIPSDAIAAEQRKLYEGAIGYGIGDDDGARRLLLPIDAHSLPSGIGGHLALVQATLLAKTDRAKAIALLDLARLLEPGTLVEEAALRKEMSLIGATGDLEKFGFLARRYLSVFSRSLYAENFRQLVGTAAVEIGRGDSMEAAQRLFKLAVHLDKDERRRLYLAVAREAVIAGRTKMAIEAAEEGQKLAPRGSGEEARAGVYLGAATIVGDRYDLGMRSLRDTPSERLDAGDRALRASAVAVAELIRKPSTNDGDAKSGAALSLIGEGERSLDAADRLLKDARK